MCPQFSCWAETHVLEGSRLKLEPRRDLRAAAPNIWPTGSEDDPLWPSLSQEPGLKSEISVVDLIDELVPSQGDL